LQQITGAGHGIGKELAVQYASLGATVVCLDINQQLNEETANEIKKIDKSPIYTYQYVSYIIALFVSILFLYCFLIRQ